MKMTSDQSMMQAIQKAVNLTDKTAVMIITETGISAGNMRTAQPMQIMRGQILKQPAFD